MQNKKRLLSILKIFVVALAGYALIFTYIYEDQKKRKDEILSHQMDNLRVHYELTEKNFQNIADVTVGMIENSDEILTLLTKFLTASPQEAVKLRIKLQKALFVYYKALQSKGVLQLHFLNPKNVTTFRMHKPSKFGDDLTDFKYSFKHTNETRKPMSGLEKGKTEASYRDVRPLYNKEGLYLGIVDVGFAPEIIQKNLQSLSHIHSHFIMKKSIFDERAWHRNDNKNDYVPSVESDQYVEFYLHSKLYDDTLVKRLINSNREAIKNSMSKEIEFSLDANIDNQALIATFLPLKNMKNEQIAYLVSYTQSNSLYKMQQDFFIINAILIAIITLISLLYYKNKRHNQVLNGERDKYYKLSLYDTLTSLPNRTLLFNRAKEAIVKAKRNHTQFALMFLDLDNFKRINDSYGHEEGDRVLLHIASKIEGLLKDECTLARFGGDEFIVILEDLEGTEDILNISERIIHQLQEPIEINSTKNYLGASIGISLYPDDATDINDLIKYADTAMYKAKQFGRNGAEFYSADMSHELMQRVKLEDEIREGIKKEEFVVYYQAQIDAKTESLVGMEALVRWQHPQRGLLSPFEFIPIAEENGLIIELDQLVMKKAMLQFSLWLEKGYNPGTLALNLSVKQLQGKDFILILKQLIEETHMKCEHLELEVTESQVMTNPEAAIKVLNEISQLGIELAIDDFGTGYSSLSYLKKLPINKLKIDKSFVDGLPIDEEDVSITQAIIALAKSLNLRVLAEGVETKEQREFLLQHECDTIQGYYYSRPISAQDLEKSFL